VTKDELIGMVRDWLTTDATFPAESDVYADLRLAVEITRWSNWKRLPTHVRSCGLSLCHT